MPDVVPEHLTAPPCGVSPTAPRGRVLLSLFFKRENQGSKRAHICRKPAASKCGRDGTWTPISQRSRRAPALCFLPGKIKQTRAMLLTGPGRGGGVRQVDTTVSRSGRGHGEGQTAHSNWGSGEPGSGQRAGGMREAADGEHVPPQGALATSGPEGRGVAVGRARL